MCVEQEKLVELAASFHNHEPLVPEFVDIKQHVDACGACGTRLNAYLQTLESVESAIAGGGADGRTNACLTDEIVAGYVDHTLNAKEKSQAEEHLSQCGFCLRQLTELIELVRATVEARPGTLRYVLGVASKGLSFLVHPKDGDFNLFSPEPIPVLGERKENPDQTRSSYVWSQCVGNLQLDFTAVHVDESHVNIALNLTRKSEVPPGTRITIWADGHMVQSEPISENGGLFLNELSLETYQGEIELPVGNTIPFTIGLQPVLENEE